MKKSFLYTIAALTIVVFTFTAFDDSMTAQEKQQVEIDLLVSERVAEFKAEKDAECQENALQIAMVQADSVATAMKATATKTRKKKSTKPKAPTTTTTTTTYTPPTTTTTYTPPPTTTTTTTTIPTKPPIGKGSGTPATKPPIGKGGTTTGDGTIKTPVIKKPMLGKGKGKGGN